MNRNKFKNKLDRARKNSFVTPFFVENLFKEERKSFFNNEAIETLIENNFASMMDGVSEGNIQLFIDAIYRHQTMHHFLEKEETIKYILDNCKYFDFKPMLDESEIKDRVQEFIYNNFDYVLANYSLKKIVYIYEYMELSDEMKVKLDKYLNTKKEEFLSVLLSNTLSFRGNVDKDKLAALFEVVVPIVDHLLEKENCRITDIKILLSGSYSNVLRIGESIIKVGIPRKTFNIPNDKRILQPHLRKDLSEEFGIEATIEVCDRVDTDFIISEDELYDLYKEMRDRGIVCGDFKYGNIGKLIRSNPPRNNPQYGMMGDVSETLEAGEYVMLDTDFIYREGDPHIELSSDLSRKFESRYQRQSIKKGR